MPAPRRILVLVIILSLGLLALKTLAATSGLAARLDPASPAWASSAGGKHGKPEKADHGGNQQATPDSSAESADADGAGAQAAPLCQHAGTAEQAGLSEAELNVYMKLAERSKVLDKRESDIATKEGLLEVSRQKLDQRIATLEALKNDIEGLLGQLDESEEKQMHALTKLYDSMKPKAAAKIFSGLDKAVLLQVASRMKADNLSKVMAAMPVAKASALTTALAAHNRLPETAGELAGSQAKPNIVKN